MYSLGLAISIGRCAGGRERWWVISLCTLCKGWVDQFSANLRRYAYLIGWTNEIDDHSNMT